MNRAMCRRINGSLRADPYWKCRFLRTTHRWVRRCRKYLIISSSSSCCCCFFSLIALLLFYFHGYWHFCQHISFRKSYSGRCNLFRAKEDDVEKRRHTKKHQTKRKEKYIIVLIEKKISARNIHGKNYYWIQAAHNVWLMQFFVVKKNEAKRVIFRWRE